MALFFFRGILFENSHIRTTTAEELFRFGPGMAEILAIVAVHNLPVVSKPQL
jgi:hypothetical protein